MDAKIYKKIFIYLSIVLLAALILYFLFRNSKLGECKEGYSDEITEIINKNPFGKSCESVELNKNKTDIIAKCKDRKGKLRDTTIPKKCDSVINNCSGKLVCGKC